MTGRLVLGSLALLLFASTAAAEADYAGMNANRYTPPKPAPEFTLPDLAGKPVRLADFKGKVVLLFFWATWCPDCLEELPSVNRLQADLGNRGLEILLIDLREDPALVRRTVSERGYRARVLLDETGDVAGKDYGVWGTPTVYVIDREGRLVARIVGARDWGKPEARRFVEALLATQPAR